MDDALHQALIDHPLTVHHEDTDEGITDGLLAIGNSANDASGHNGGGKHHHHKKHRR